jgi:lipopolysaccharide export LptBFGC system permease protein LptF
LRTGFPILFLLLITAEALGQKDSVKSKNDSLPDRFYLIQEIERNGVKMPEIEIKEVTIHARTERARRSEYRQYEKLVLNIKKVYPYALIVRVKLAEVNEELKNYSNEREKKRYLKDVEKDVFKQYQNDIENMTISQGRLLIKLIDRETQNTSYTLIREYRGKFSAAFWQSIARIFGTNLKEEYDPYGEDALIEAIIKEIDAGRL